MTRPVSTPADRGRAGDRGLTLVEVVISVALGSMLSGVVIAMLITSLNVARKTTEISHDATDAGLIATFWTRDAQAAGGTDPATLAALPDLGASTTDWAGCEQPGELVARFAWLDRLDPAGGELEVTTWALDPDGVLNRRACRNGDVVDAALGEHVVDATATCRPDPDCGVGSSVVELAVTGSSATATSGPSVTTLSATLRSTTTTSATPTGSAAPLVVLTGDGGCPDLDVGVGRLVVLGDAIVDADCGFSPDPGRVTISGQLARADDVTDPYGGVASGVPSCGSGSGASIGDPLPSTTAVFADPVVVDAPVELAPGRYVLCSGLDVRGTGVLTGDDVTIVVVAGDVLVAPGAAIDLTAPTSGPAAHLLLTAAGDVSLGASSRSHVWRGVVHVPEGTVTIGSSAAIGALVTDRLTIADSGAVRLGFPLPEVSVGPSELTEAHVGVAYPGVDLVAEGGTGPYTWEASGLPDGLSLSADGRLSGAPTTAGSSTMVVAVTDASGLVTTVEREIVVRAELTVVSAALADGEVGSPYASTIEIAGGQPPYSVSVTGLPAGLSVDDDGEINGTPTTAGVSAVTVTASDASGATVSRNHQLTVTTTGTSDG